MMTFPGCSYGSREVRRNEVIPELVFAAAAGQPLALGALLKPSLNLYTIGYSL